MNVIIMASHTKSVYELILVLFRKNSNLVITMGT